MEVKTKILTLLLLLVSSVLLVSAEPYIYCSDGTPVGSCSTLNPGLYCDYNAYYNQNGILVLDSNKCSANAGKCCQSTPEPTTANEVSTYSKYLAVNIPSSESCSNAYQYFDESYVGTWVDNTFTEQPGIAKVLGGFPTSIRCIDSGHKITAPDQDPFKPYVGVRGKSGAYMSVEYSMETFQDRQKQAAVLDWTYYSTSYFQQSGSTLDLFFPINNVNILSCQTLSTSNIRYTLSSDLIQNADEDCITIAAENITLDCQNHSIITTSSATISGVYSNQKATVVKNCAISDFAYGINIDDTSNSIIQDNTLTSNSITGIRMSNSDSSHIFSNNASNNLEGIYLSGSGNNISYNEICTNTNVDINADSSNSGDENTCNTAQNWNDEYYAVCAHLCFCEDADLDCNNYISNSELEAYSTKWKNGAHGVTSLKLARLALIWHNQ